MLLLIAVSSCCLLVHRVHRVKQGQLDHTQDQLPLLLLRFNCSVTWLALTKKKQCSQQAKSETSINASHTSSFLSHAAPTAAEK